MMPTRNRPTGAPTSSRYGRTGGGATTGSPGSAPAATSSIAAQSRTERVTANCTLRKRLSSPNAGPIDTRPRDVFSPTSPHALAGRRIEPPPSGPPPTPPGGGGGARARPSPPGGPPRPPPPRARPAPPATRPGGAALRVPGVARRPERHRFGRRGQPEFRCVGAADDDEAR